RSDAYFVFPLAQGTPGKQCGLAATGVYQPSLRSPWLAANECVNFAGLSCCFCCSLLAPRCINSVLSAVWYRHRMVARRCN
ncbi:hypothetical protein, partial [Thiolapillus sp.]|uniref:hypothetical protein n=1 Tax=Thiolapillus sp. TaxID=2017437 RepID=UPI003AF4AC1A